MMGNYDRDDAFFAITNKNREVREQVAGISSKIDDEYRHFRRRTAEAERVVARENERKRQIERKKKIRVMALTAAIIATLGAGITTAVKYGDDISVAIEERRDYEDAIGIMNYNYEMVFSARQLTNCSILNDNNIQKYRDLNITSMEDVYFFKYESHFRGCDNFDKEFDKIIRSVTYYDSEGKICYYSSFEDFLKINGFSSEEEFKKAAKERIISLYRDGKIKALLYEGIGTVNMPINSLFGGKGK